MGTVRTIVTRLSTLAGTQPHAALHGAMGCCQSGGRAKHRHVAFSHHLTLGLGNRAAAVAFGPRVKSDKNDRSKRTGTKRRRRKKKRRKKKKRKRKRKRKRKIKKKKKKKKKNEESVKRMLLPLYCVAKPNQYLVRTGWRFPDVQVSKKGWVLPGQKYTYIDASPVNYTLNLQVHL
ncbi:hypothetical protein CBR_g30844 [Chara braunii]|uniref:Uncharacterized protein n=1 Tax=Chara braunii TaxID=69332 RepID=A0A388JXM9_CHABU|nr:hypothetical protein CBR_g30844 [Chara braunii]|eukprot:GBG62527.1 hypothetical protein CBR_g30844 [Chara braunii]